MICRVSSITTLLFVSGALLFVAGPVACGGDDFEPDNGGGSSGVDGGSGSGGTGAKAGGGSAGSSAVAGTAGTTTKDPNGTACTDATSCESGFCVDDVCCDQACTGVCESCAVSGSEGTCTPRKSGTDPEAGCLGAGQAGDVCVGTCDGNGACAFPGASTSCGATSCAAGTQTDHVCGGDGSCKTTEMGCGDYACGTTSCNTSCASHTECAATAWCNVPSCEQKKENGASCGAAIQCVSGFCEGQYCCATACAAPGSCGGGTCTCAGAVCDLGKKCISWYLDQDNDGYGKTSSFDKPGCEGQPPSDPGGKKYYPSTNPEDCDDTNANVHPGQTAWFTTPYATSNWDYNCSKSTEYEYPTGNSSTTCSACCPSSPCVICNGGNWYLGGCATKQVAAFAEMAVGCGQTGTLKSCSNLCQAMTSTSAKQGCH